MNVFLATISNFHLFSVTVIWRQGACWFISIPIKLNNSSVTMFRRIFIRTRVKHFSCDWGQPCQRYQVSHQYKESFRDHPWRHHSFEMQEGFWWQFLASSVQVCVVRSFGNVGEWLLLILIDWADIWRWGSRHMPSKAVGHSKTRDSVRILIPCDTSSSVHKDLEKRSVKCCNALLSRGNHEWQSMEREIWRLRLPSERERTYHGDNWHLGRVCDRSWWTSSRT